MKRSKVFNFFKNLWILPFLVFFSTYITLHLWFQSHSFAMPSLCSMHLLEATKLLSTYKLHPEIARITPDPTIPDGTVIHQVPPAGRMVKEQQTVYVVITERPADELSPACIGLSQEQIKQIAHDRDIPVSFYNLPYHYPTGTCFAQWPSAQQPLSNEPLICYLAQEEDDLCIMPQLKGKTAQEVKAFLEPYGITVQTNIKPDQRLTYYIHEQQPKAGSCIRLQDIDTIYVTIQTKQPA